MTLDRTAPHVGDRYTPTKIAWRTRLGPVWFARDQVLGRQVLIQTVDADDHATRARFRASAAAHARVTNPGVIQVFDIGSDPPFAVFENPGGGRLSDRLRGGTLQTPEAARIALALARALEALHTAGLHHGALRPDVVLLDPDGRAKLLALDPDGANDQPASYRPSTEVSPEATDVYALAALTWQMVTGTAPGTVRGRRAGGDLDAVLRRALDPEPARRPALDRFISDLAPFARVVQARSRAPRARAMEFGWLVPAVIIVTLAILAATLGVRYAKDLADRTAGDGSSTPSVRPTLVAVDVVGAADVDPEGDRRENPDLVDRAIDGDATSSWRTERYERAGLGGKSGVGLRLDLGEPVRINRVQILSRQPGWTAEVRTGDQDGRRARDYAIVATFTAAASKTVRLPQPVTTRYVLIWITQLVDAADGKDPPYLASIAEVRIFAP